MHAGRSVNIRSPPEFPYAARMPAPLSAATTSVMVYAVEPMFPVNVDWAIHRHHRHGRIAARDTVGSRLKVGAVAAAERRAVMDDDPAFLVCAKIVDGHMGPP